MVVIISMIIYNIIIILSPAAVAATHDIIIKINIIVVDKIAEIIIWSLKGVVYRILNKFNIKLINVIAFI